LHIIINVILLYDKSIDDKVIHIVKSYERGYFEVYQGLEFF